MKVTVYSTQMGEKSITSQAKTWGDLQTELRKNGITFSKMKAVVGETKTTLEAPGAETPKEDYTLFLMPVKTKSGLCEDCAGLSYKELRGSIKIILDSDESAKAHFNVGKNYTTKSTDALKELYSAWKHKDSGTIEATATITVTAVSYEGLPYKVLRASIKSILDEVGDNARNHFNQGKNYTLKGTEVMRELLQSWTGYAPTITSGVVQAEVHEEVEEMKAVISKKEKKEKKKEKKLKKKSRLAVMYNKLIQDIPGIYKTEAIE